VVLEHRRQLRKGEEAVTNLRLTDDVPASTLLLPYFEVDLVKDT
jgi:hypothetical protein